MDGSSVTALSISTELQAKAQSTDPGPELQHPGPDPAAHQAQTSIIPVQLLLQLTRPQLAPSSCDREQESRGSPSEVLPALANPRLPPPHCPPRQGGARHEPVPHPDHSLGDSQTKESPCTEAARLGRDPKADPTCAVDASPARCQPCPWPLVPEYCCCIWGGLQGAGDCGIWYCSEPGGCRNPTDGLWGREGSSEDGDGEEELGHLRR